MKRFWIVVLAVLSCGSYCCAARAQSFDLSNGFAGSSGFTRSGSAIIAGNYLRLTEPANPSTGWYYTSTLLDVRSFHNHFVFQLLPSYYGAESILADGITFTIQRVSPTAYGGGGGNLGTGISPAVTIKFDVYDNAGEGTSSTGLYINGTPPTVPAIDLRPYNIDLQGGHVFDVTMDYDGAVLSVTIKDTKTGASATQNYNVNIPGVMGASNAFIGFTGNEGGLGMLGSILAWDWNRTPTRTVRVSQSGNDANDGSTWAAAVRTIQRGCNLAGAGGDVWVAGGTYNEHITIPSKVSVYGGFSGVETQLNQRNWTANQTILDGGGTGNGVVLQSGRPERLDGITIQHCQRAVLGDSATCWIENCRIVNNANGGWGSGYQGGDGSPIILNSEFSNNTSPGDGGAIFNVAVNSTSVYPYITQSSFTGNAAKINVNNAGGIGGAIAIYYTKDIVIAGNTFRNNSSDYISGTIDCYTPNGGGITLVDNEITGGDTRGYGSGGCDMYYPAFAVVKRNVIRQCKSANEVGGFYILSAGRAKLVLNEFDSNVGYHSGGGWIYNVPTFFSLVNYYHGNSSLGAGGLRLDYSAGTNYADAFWDNHSEGSGGGLLSINSNVTVHRNSFGGNHAYGGGAIAVYNGSTIVQNGLFYSNDATFGGAVDLNYSTDRVLNNTFAYNHGATGAGVAAYNASPEVANNILAFNVGAGIEGFSLPGASGPPNIHQNDFFGNTELAISGAPAGSNNTSFDPRFVNPAGIDFRLKPTSPAIDAGDNSAVLPGYNDQIELPRIFHGLVDLGCYEYQGAPDRTAPVTSATLSPQPNAGNWNNGAVTVTLLAVDSSGVESVNYRVNGGGWTSVAGDTANVQITQEGDSTVEFYATDGVNQESTKSQIVKLDSVAPTTTLSREPGNDSLITLKFTDDTSGVQATYYRINSQPAQTYSGPFDVVGAGSFTVAYWSTDAAGNIESEKTLVLNLQPPASPTNLTAVYNATGPGTLLNWTDNSSNERSFVIERKDALDYSVVATVGPNVTTYTDTTVQTNTKYTYRVRARNSAGDSGYSNEASLKTLAVPAPDTLTLAITNHTTANLTWKDKALNELGYSVEMKVNNGAYSEIQQLGVNAISTSVPGLAPGNTFTFRVRAFAAGVYSDYSNEASVLIPPVPNAPSNLNVQRNSSTAPQVKLTWTDNSSDEQGFTIYKSVNGGPWTSAFAIGPNAQLAFDTVNYPNSTVRYRVTAIGQGGESDPSNEATVTFGAAPAAPSNLTATRDNQAKVVNLKWTDNSDNEASFEIQISRNGGSSYTTIRNAAANTTSYSAQWETGSAKYRVRAVNSEGYSDWVEVTLN